MQTIWRVIIALLGLFNLMIGIGFLLVPLQVALGGVEAWVVVSRPAAIVPLLALQTVVTALTTLFLYHLRPPPVDAAAIGFNLLLAALASGWAAILSRRWDK